MRSRSERDTATRLCFDLAHHRGGRRHPPRRRPADPRGRFGRPRHRQASRLDPGAILDAIDNEAHNGSGCGELIERGRQLAEELAADATDKVRATLMALLCRVQVGSDRIDTTLSRGRFAELLAGSIVLKMQHQGATNAPGDILRLTAPAGLKRVGRQMRMLVKNADPTSVDPSLLRILVRANDVQARLIQNPKLTVHDIAREEKVSAAHLYSILRLAGLSPDIATSIVHGRQPLQLTAKTLMRLTPRLPADWAEQQKMLGFR